MPHLLLTKLQIQTRKSSSALNVRKENIIKIDKWCLATNKEFKTLTFNSKFWKTKYKQANESQENVSYRKIGEHAIGDKKLNFLAAQKDLI